MTKNKALKVVVIFNFEELNTNVFINSLVFNLKKDRDVEFHAYVPIGFTSLFFSADFHHIIPQEFLDYDRYSEVSEYFPKIDTIRKRLQQRASNKFNHLLIKVLGSGRIPIFLHIHFLKLYKTDRQKKFLFNGKTDKFIFRDIKNLNLKKSLIFVAQDYLKFKQNNIFVHTDSLTISYKYFFDSLGKAICNGMVLKTGKSNNNKIVIRTRNYLNKQPMHNSKLDELLKLLVILKLSDKIILNIGSPALQVSKDLDLPPVKYIEMSNILTLDEEIALLDCPIIVTTVASVFMLVACIDKPIICMFDEWDVVDVNLIDCRRSIGFKDDLKRSEWQGNYFKIYEHINNLTIKNSTI